MKSRSAAGRRARLVVGLMAGTSLDGVDAALVRINGPATSPRVRPLAFVTVPYRAALRRRLLGVASGEATTAGEISQLNFELGERFAQAALTACRKAAVPARRLDFIGSHGQTIFHAGPSLSKTPPITLQIAEPAVIAARTGAPVVADFRVADLAVGGQGAPLVPLVDYLLLRDEKCGTVALNIGGIANLTVIPRGARMEQVFGFDTGPGNMVMDGLMRHFTRGRRSYDAGGHRAARGKVAAPVLERALRLPFFRRPPPKSAGREQFGDAFLERLLLRPPRPSPRDLLRTATELTARTVSGALHQFVFPRLAPGSELHRLVVSGGGAHNRFLIRRLGELVPELIMELSDDLGLPADAKEAIAFAVLADRTMHGLTGNLPRVTGARRALVLGKVVWP